VRSTIAWIGLAVSPLQVVLAQSLEDAVRICAAETDSLRRLVCYDRAAANFRPAGPAAIGSSIATPVAAPGADAAAASAAQFGVRNGPLDQAKDARGLKQIIAVITRLETQPRGEIVLTLDNGQMWQQNELLEYFPLAVGQRVQIRRGALDSYILYAPSKRSTRVVRIR
jgi:hypothetical protein